MVALTKPSSAEDTRIHSRCEQKVAIGIGKKAIVDWKGWFCGGKVRQGCTSVGTVSRGLSWDFVIYGHWGNVES